MGVQAERDGDTIAIKSEYRDKDLIRQVPGATWDPAAKVWRTPLAWGACLALRGVFADRLEIGPDLAAWAWGERTARINPCLAIRTQHEDTDLDPDNPHVRALIAVEAQLSELGLALRPFQRVGAVFMAMARRILLADEMGTGKTIQAIVALRILDQLGEDVFPALVIAPNSMKQTWAREFTKWWPELDPTVVITGSASVRRKAIDTVKHVGVINWESVRLHSRLAPYGSVRLSDAEKEPKELNRIPWRTVIADEAHKLKDPKTKQTRATWQVGRGAEFRFALTGTPVTNAPDTMWSALHFVDHLDWPVKTKYIDRYCLSSFNAFGGLTVIGIRPEMQQEFFGILDPRMRRMPKELVLTQLPPIVQDRRYIDMDPKQAKAYASMTEAMIAKLDDGAAVMATTPLSQLTRLVQFASAHAEVDSEGNVKLTDPSNKLDALMEDLEDLGTEPVVVFAQSRQLIEMAARRLEKADITYRMVVGGQAEHERQQHVDDFQAGRARVMLVTIQAGGVGLTLTKARIGIFLQRPWSHVDNAQAEARIHRIGSEVHESVVIIDYVSQGTVEERMLEVLADKESKLEAIVRDADLLKKLIGG